MGENERNLMLAALRRDAEQSRGGLAYLAKVADELADATAKVEVLEREVEIRKQDYATLTALYVEDDAKYRRRIDELESALTAMKSACDNLAVGNLREASRIIVTEIRKRAESKVDGVESQLTGANERARMLLEARDHWAQRARAAERALAEARRDGERLDWLMRECARLEPFVIPTGCGDADVGWQVVKFYQAEPSEQVISAYASDNPRVAIDAAMSTTAAKAGE